MRIRLIAWWCGRCGRRNTTRTCYCGQARFEKHAQVHSSERAVVYYNPATGERRTPARADQPMPEAYAAAGFERREIMSMSSYEKETGLIHEATNFSPGNENVPMKEVAPSAPKELKEELINDMRDAIASGPWTGVV